MVVDHVRERARLEHVWIFTHGRDEESAPPLAELARSPDRAIDDEATASARAVALGTVRGNPRRFVRRSVTVDGRLHAVAARTGGQRVVSVVASATDGPHVLSESESALGELAEIAARVVAAGGSAEPRPRLPQRDPARAVSFGVGLTDALAALERPPIHAESRLRVAQALGQRHPAIGQAVQIVETDVGLSAAIVGAANRLRTRSRHGVASVPAAFEVLGPRGVLRVVADLPVLRPFVGADRVGTALARLSSHSIATRAAADLIMRHLGVGARDEVRLLAILHDLGKVVLAGASEDYLAAMADRALTPEQALAEERKRLAIDHAAIGAIAVRRLGLPKGLATAVERHHADDAGGPAALVRLADMLAHEAHGDPVTPGALATAARGFGVDPVELQRVAYDLSRSRSPRETSVEPSPLTAMQERVLHALAARKTYKQIGAELSISESTVRSHLHNIYGRLDVADRAQAVLLAAERGWI